MKSVKFLSLYLILLSVTGFLLSSCIEKARTLFAGNSIVIEGKFRPLGPVTPEKDVLPFYLLSYKNPEPGQKFPLLLALHGSGDQGESYLEVWRGAAEKKKFMILAPTRLRAYENKFKDLKAILDLVNQVVAEYPVDSKRLYLAGVSSGSLIAKWLLAYSPTQWKAVILIASSPSLSWDDLKAEALPPLLFVHGRRDEQFDFTKVFENARQLRSRGAVVGFIDDPDGGHGHKTEWNQSIFEWLQKHEKSSAG